MSKIFILLFLALTTLFSNPIEDESFSFVGIGTTIQTLDIPEGKDKRPKMFSLQYGEQTTEWRTTFNYQMNTEYCYEYQTLSMDVDKFILDSLFGTAKLRPYLGVSIGALRLIESTIDDENGFFYGGRGGFVLYLHDRVDLDINYHHNLIQDLNALETTQGINLSLHYFY